MRIFLSAGPTARPHALPALISGFESEIPDGSTMVCVEPAMVRAATRETIAPRLVGRPTKQIYHGLPWWVVEVKS